MFCAGFFHTRKKFKNFSKEVIKSHLSFPIWCGKRDKHFSNHSGKGVRLMKPSDFQKTVQCRFESCFKKVVRLVVKDYQQGLKRRKDKEIPFCELPERKRNTLLMYYFLEMTESEIANLQKITQSGVFRNRHHALETMKKILKEKQ